jgi:hypothetical protein
MESGVEPALAKAALDGNVLDLQRAIGARLHESAGKSETTTAQDYRRSPRCFFS